MQTLDLENPKLKTSVSQKRKIVPILLGPIIYKLQFSEKAPRHVCSISGAI